MKILELHCDYASYTPKEKALKTGYDEVPAEEIGREKRFEEVLVILTCVEEGDSAPVASRMASEVEKNFNEVKAKQVLVYPYAHLSSKLASPKEASILLNEFCEEIRKFSPSAARAPFGWYKAFDWKCKGHPLSELSKSISAEDVGAEAQAAKKVKTIAEKAAEIKSEYLILTPEGKEYPLPGVSLSQEQLNSLGFLDAYPTLKKFVGISMVKGVPAGEPPSIRMMRALEFVDYEPASDPGNFRFLPNGTLVHELLAAWAEQIACERFNCIKIETPLIYDWAQPDIRAQGESFHEKHYIVRVPDDARKELVLRFAGDFGLFRTMKDATFSYKQLPIRIYEFSKSFRYEQRGELSGLRRLRGFTMPDIHSFCADLGQGWHEYQELYKNYADLADATEIQYAIAFRVVKEFYDKHKDKIIELLKYSKQPALIEVLAGMKHYWAVKHEFQAIDWPAECQLSTVQLDVADAERYGITYVASDGKKKGCIICHSSVGSIERWMFAILEHALTRPSPELPMWLSPTQVRLLPVSEAYIDLALSFAGQFSKRVVRVDVDDRNITLGKKIMDAEHSWVPLTITVGEKEKAGAAFKVRPRGGKDLRDMSLDQIVDLVSKGAEGKPFKPLTLSVRLSQRPIFIGA